MQVAIDVLIAEREKIVAELKTGNKSALLTLQEIDVAIAWLRLLLENNAKNAQSYTVQKLPSLLERGYGSSNYRLMVDMETDSTEQWIEFENLDQSHFLLSEGDIVMIER